MQAVTDVVYREVANAVVIQAAADYRNALLGKGYDKKTPEKIIKEIEDFFRSSWYRTLTKVDGEYLMERIKRDVEIELNSNKEEEQIE